jgi:hypothetical protein
MKKLIVLPVVFFFMNSCAHTNRKSGSENSGIPIEFTEERRLNHSNGYPETKIVNSLEEITKIYGELKDDYLPKSAPIPSFDSEKESIIVLKPKLKDRTYADIEIQQIQMDQTDLIITYSEVENWEFTENKWTDPILIIKVAGKPKKVVLNKQ